MMRTNGRCFGAPRSWAIGLLEVLLFSVYAIRVGSGFVHPTISSMVYAQKQHTYIPSTTIILQGQQHARSSRRTPSSSSVFGVSKDDDENDSSTSIWMPQLRRTMAGIATLGLLETSYLTYSKLFTESHLPAFCASSSGSATTTPSACESVLTGPYSTIPYTGVPLATLGLVAYSLVVYLSLAPLVQKEPSSSTDTPDDTSNRIFLTALTTTMGTFSVFLMAMLFGVLHAPCPYCIFSAACSISLAQMAWIAGCLPEESSSSSQPTTKSTLSVAVPSSLLVGIVAAVILYFGSSSPPTMNGGGSGGDGSNLLASTSTTTLAAARGTETKLYSPPEITTTSSQRAIKLAESLQSLDAKMYGAYWCSHCYDQKQVLGKQAFDSYVSYVECSKDGMNSQTKLCKSKDVPGYPTWEIQGKLYPGQQELDELEELVQGLLLNK